MIRNMTIASDLGYLSIPAGSQVRLNDAIDAAPADIVLICTGSQGEPLSALARMARDEHKIHPHPGDLVILSARLIPGNETDIFRVVNDLSRLGARVLHTENAPIHASGHAGANDLGRVLDKVRPRYLVPIHGEWRHMRAHAEVAYAAGMSDESVILMANGDVLDVTHGKASLIGSYKFTDIYVDGGTVGLVGARILSERRQLGADGILNVAVAVDESSGEIFGAPTVSSSGLPTTDADERDAAVVVAQTVATWARTDPRTLADLQRDVTRNLRKWMRERHRFEPYVFVSAIPIPPVDGGRR